MKNETPLASWQILLLVGVLVVALILGVLQRSPSEQTDEVDNQIPVILNAQTCTASGGTWQDLGLISQCLCEDQADCPFGSTCSQVGDERVCTNSF